MGFFKVQRFQSVGRSVKSGISLSLINKVEVEVEGAAEMTTEGRCGRRDSFLPYELSRRRLQRLKSNIYCFLNTTLIIYPHHTLNMPPTSSLHPAAQILESQFKRAWNLFSDDKYDEVSRAMFEYINIQVANIFRSQANSLSRELLNEPRLDRLHRAGLHVILAHSSDDYVWHASEAVRLYEAMYPDPGQVLTKNQLRSKKELLDHAKAVQAKALVDEKSLAESPPSEGEKRDSIQQQVDASAEMEDGLMREADEQTESGEVRAEEVDGVAEQEDMAVGDSNDNDNVSMLTPLRGESDEEALEERAMMQPKE